VEGSEMNPWEKQWVVDEEPKPWEKDWSSTEVATPWTAYGVPANPEDENILTRLGRGANINLTKMAMGLKDAVSSLTPEDEAKMAAGSEYQDAALRRGDYAPAVGGFGMDLFGYSPAGGFASAIPRVAAATGLSALFAPKDRGMAALTGSAGAIGGELAGAGLSKLIRGPVAQPGVKEFVEAGGKPSFAQALGQPYKRLEETASSLPLVGPPIDQQQVRAIESFNKAGLQEVVDDLKRGGVDTNIDVQPGAHGFKELSKVVSDAYGDLASRYDGRMTQQFQQVIDDVRQLAKEIPPREGHINRIIDDQILPYFKDGNPVPGDKVKVIDTTLGRLARQYGKEGGDGWYVGEAANQLRKGLHDMIGDANPEAKDALQAINSAYGKFKTMQKAMTSSVGNELATPASTLQVMRTRNPSAFAKGEMPMQDLSRNANNIIGNRYPDSGTAGRLQAKDLLVGGATGFIPGAMAYYGSKNLYQPAIQDWLVNQSLKTPGLKRLMLMEMARRSGAPAGAAATDTLR
jgi:hypothetical protein